MKKNLKYASDSGWKSHPGMGPYARIRAADDFCEETCLNKIRTEVKHQQYTAISKWNRIEDHQVLDKFARNGNNRVRELFDQYISHFSDISNFHIERLLLNTYKVEQDPLQTRLQQLVI